MASSVRANGAVARRRAVLALDHAEFDQLVEAVVDVQPQASEGAHQRFDVERLVRPGAQEPQEAGAQRRLDERPGNGPRRRPAAAAGRSEATARLVAKLMSFT